MLANRWDEGEAQAAEAQAVAALAAEAQATEARRAIAGRAGGADTAAEAAARALALRVYSARLIGQEPELVMHGGGNTSLKARAVDVFGDTVDVLHIKGSGWDLATIEAAGMPAVRLAPLLRLRGLPALSDAAMVNVQRANLLDSAAPTPSVEALLHAWLPQKVVDHTHATAFLVLANLPEAADALRELFGARLTLVPYIMPGFALAKAAAEAHERVPEAEGLLLANHGHFTWGQTARESYDRLLAQTNLVEEWLARRRPAPLVPAAALPAAALPAKESSDTPPAAPPPVTASPAATSAAAAPLADAPDAAPPAAELAPLLAALRGALASALPEDAALPLLDLRTDAATRAFTLRDDLAALATRGVATPDHVIRTKAHPLRLSRAALSAGPEALRAEVAAWAERYRAYFQRQNARVGGGRRMLAPLPGLVWIEGAGIAGVGASAGAARVAADLGCQTARIMADGERLGGFRPIGEDDLFDMEYWPLEQAKLGRGTRPRLQGRVVLLTGGAGAIGRAIARAFAAEGAALFLVDREAAALAEALAALGRDHGGLALDITAPGAPAQAVAACTRRFGGLDILIGNAGAATTGEMATLPEATLRASFELNFFAHHAFAQAAVASFRAQSAGRGGRGAGDAGQILLNVSKQAVNPGRNFGAYGLPKAASFFLLRQLALELGAEGIRVNGVNADRIRSGLLSPGMIHARAEARGISEAAYMAGNLLGREVEAAHVAQAFVFLAGAERTTGHAITVDGGNIEAALR